MSRTLLRECLTLLENIIEETSLSDDDINRACELIESIKHELGWVAQSSSAITFTSAVC